MTTDSDEKNLKKSDSRLAKHLQIMGLEDHGFSKDELTAETKGMASMKPPALDLSGASSHAPGQKPRILTPPSRMPWYSIGAVAAAAMLALIIFRPQEDPGYRVKGAAQVVVYMESGGDVRTWDKKTPLTEGVRVRVEFKALEDTVAFVGVIDGKGTNLFAPEVVWANRISLSAGQVATSSGSIEITGPDEDEMLIVASCPAANAPADLQAFSALWADSEGLGRICAVEKMQLR